MNTDQIAAEAALSALGRQNPRFNLYRGQDPSFRQADVDFWTSEFKTAIKKATVELQEERDYYESRRGGECQKCGSWVCPPLTCLSCLAGLDLHDELRKENQRLTEKLQHPETAAAAPATASEQECLNCGKPVGNPVFTYCDNCWSKPDSDPVSEQCPECGTTGGRHKGLCGGGKPATASEQDDTKRQIKASEKLCEIYFNIAAQFISEDEIRKRRDIAIDAAMRKET